MKASLLDELWELLLDCGMPEKVPEKDLLLEIYWMLEELYDVDSWKED